MTTKRVGRGGDDLLAQVGAAAALDQPAVGGDLVGAVDRDVEPLQAVEVLDRDAELARLFLGGDRGGDAADAAEAAARRSPAAGRRRSSRCRGRPSSRPRPAPPRPPPPAASRYPPRSPRRTLSSPGGRTALGLERRRGAAVGGAERGADRGRALAGGRRPARGRGGLLEPPGDRAARRGADGDRPRQPQRHRAQRRAAGPAAAAARRRHADRRRPPAGSLDRAGDAGRGDGRRATSPRWL